MRITGLVTLIVLMLLLGLTACDNSIPSNINVTGGTKHVIGLDLESWTDVFEKSCRTECVQTLTEFAPEEAINACVDTCIGQRISDIISFIEDNSETESNP